jgi:hypothetical protein
MRGINSLLGRSAIPYSALDSSLFGSADFPVPRQGNPCHGLQVSVLIRKIQ